MLGFNRLNLTPNPAITKRVIEIRVTNWIGSRMAASNWAATTIPLPFCIVILYWMDPEPLYRVHEWIHVQQNQDAKFWFVAWYRYIKEWAVEAWKHTPNKWDLLRPWRWYQIYGNGYFSNKYEVEAYAVEYSDRDNNTIPDWA